jgi:hypothetical protein
MRREVAKDENIAKIIVQVAGKRMSDAGDKFEIKLEAIAIRILIENVVILTSF